MEFYQNLVDNKKKDRVVTKFLKYIYYKNIYSIKRIIYQCSKTIILNYELFQNKLSSLWVEIIPVSIDHDVCRECKMAELHKKLNETNKLKW